MALAQQTARQESADPQLLALKVPPHSVEAEQSLLGGLLLDEAESKIFQIAESGARLGQGLLEIKPVLARVFERIDHLYHRDNPSDVTGVPTGFIDLDRMTAGLQPGDLVIIAGRPSMGKTALALNIAEHVAVDNGLPG